jgi:hypothetical protein
MTVVIVTSSLAPPLEQVKVGEEQQSGVVNPSSKPDGAIGTEVNEMAKPVSLTDVKEQGSGGGKVSNSLTGLLTAFMFSYLIKF